MGPTWYWRANAEAILRHGNSKVGKITRHAFKYGLTASEVMDVRLDTYYARIESIVRTVMSEQRCTTEERAYTEDEIVDEYKNLILAMQGSWTSQHTYSWSVCNARYEEDAPAAVHMWRPNADESAV